MGHVMLLPLAPLLTDGPTTCFSESPCSVLSLCRYYEVNPTAKLLTDGLTTCFSENPSSVLSVCRYYEVNSTAKLLTGGPRCFP